MPWEVLSFSQGWDPWVLSTLYPLIIYWELPVWFVPPHPPSGRAPRQHPGFHAALPCSVSLWP